MQISFNKEFQSFKWDSALMKSSTIELGFIDILIYKRFKFIRTVWTVSIIVRDLFQLGDWGLLPENFLHRPNFQNERTTKSCLQQNCAYYMFYTILKRHWNGYKQNNINWQYVKSRSSERFLLDPRLWEDKDSARKMEMLPEKIDYARIWGGLQPPQSPRLVRLWVQVLVTFIFRDLKTYDIHLNDNVLWNFNI